MDFRALIRPKNLFFAVFVILFVGVAMALSLWGWTPTWTRLEVLTMSPVFADMRTVQGALKSIDAGYDPYRTNPFDPWQRPFNYPSIWLALGRLLHLDDEFNYLFIVGFYVAAYLFFCGYLIRKYPSVWLLLLTISGSSLLAIERGNNDLLVFGLFALSLLSSSIWVLSGLLLAATILKIFPIFGALSLARHRRQIVLTIVPAVAYFVIGRDELWSIAAASPAGTTLSYGTGSLALWLKTVTPISIHPVGLSLLLIAVIAGLVAVPTVRDALQCKPEATDQHMEPLFLMGAGIYACTFLLLSNYDYRLIFLLFCVPYVSTMASARARTLLLTAMIVASNAWLLQGVLGSWGSFLNIIAKVLVFAMLGAMGALTAYQAFRSPADERVAAKP